MFTWSEMKKHVDMSLGLTTHAWVTSLRWPRCVILVIVTLSNSVGQHMHAAPITHSPQNRKTLTCWRTDVMWLLWFLPLPGDRTTIEAAPKELSNTCVFLGSVFFFIRGSISAMKIHHGLMGCLSQGHCTREHLSAESASLSKDCKQVHGIKLSYN